MVSDRILAQSREVAKDKFPDGGPFRYHQCHLMLHWARKRVLPTQIVDRSMTYLAQSLAISSAGGNPDIGAFSGVMTTVRNACGLMSEGFREVCLDVKVGVQMTLVEATSHDQAFAAKAAKDLDLWTSALQLLFDTDVVPEAEMET